MNKNIKLILIFMIFSSCSAVKESLTLNKKNNSDEFLVEKKSPLVLPPEYGILPKPGDEMLEENNLDIKQENISIGKNTIIKKKTLKSSSIEKTIIENIK